MKWKVRRDYKKPERSVREKKRKRKNFLRRKRKRKLTKRKKKVRLAVIWLRNQRMILTIF